MRFAIGDRVIHTKTKGRVRGKVVRIVINEARTTCDVIVDGLGRDFTYDERNLELESNGDGAEEQNG